ncbi:MAG: mismatch repair protein MutS [Candidatus Dependentiae bacterium]|nr:mismatch repair protein MutS [Candidatus Dependentiae bacterium]
MRIRILFLMPAIVFSIVGSGFSTNRYQDIEALYVGMLAKPQSLSGNVSDLPDEDANTKLQLPTLTRSDLIFASLDKLKTVLDHQDPIPCTNVITPEVWSNLELFTNQSRIQEKTVVGALSRTQTVLGELTLTRLLLDPTTDIACIQSRQHFLKQLVTNDTLYYALSDLITHVAQEETNLVAMLRATDTFNQESILNWYDSFGKLRSPTAISCVLNTIHLSTLLIIPIMLGTGLAAGAVTAYTLKNYEQKKLGLLVLSGFISLLSLSRTKEACSIIKELSSVTVYIQRRLAAVNVLLTHLSKIVALSETATFPELSRYTHRYKTEDAPKLKALMARLSYKKFTPPSHGGIPSTLGNIFSHQGYVANALLEAKKVLPLMLDGLTIIGYVDAYLSLATLLRERANTTAPYCFVEFLEHTGTPMIIAEHFYHPAISFDKVVTNSVIIGAPNYPNNIIISGVNAGGKSTIMKALALCCIMGQTVGIAPAQRYAFTPFHTINTYLNITDDVSKQESLFRAELARAHTLLTTIAGMPSSQLSFTILDEICTGTEAIEGEALAWAVADRLSHYPNSITLLSTHFSGLIDLEAETGGLYKNMKVVVNKDQSGAFVYPYRLQDGPTTQQIAPDLLEQIGLPLVMTEKMRDVLKNPSLYANEED